MSNDVLIRGLIQRGAAASVNAALAKLTDSVTVRIDSTGGDSREGFAIHDALARFPGVVRVVIDGLAASAAADIAMAGDVITISSRGMMMVHNTQARTDGDKQRHMATAKRLEPIDERAIALYVDSRGLSHDTVAEMFDNETWFTAHEALAAGLVDGIA